MSEAQFCLWIFVIWSNFDRVSAETMAEMVAIPVAILGPKVFGTCGPDDNAPGPSPSDLISARLPREGPARALPSRSVSACGGWLDRGHRILGGKWVEPSAPLTLW